MTCRPAIVIERSYGSTRVEELLYSSRRQPEHITSRLFSGFPHNSYAFPNRVIVCFFKLCVFLKFLLAFVFSKRSRACARHMEELVIDYERAFGRSEVWRALACGRVGGRRETAGFVSSRLEVVVEKGRSEKTSYF